MRLFQNEHKGARLTYPATDAQRNIVVDYSFVVRETEEILLARHFKLDFECIGVDSDAHTGQFVAALCDGIPDEYVTV